MFDLTRSTHAGGIGSPDGDVLTVLPTQLQLKLNVALGPTTRPIHLESVPAAISLARKVPVRAVLLGPDAIEPALASAVATLCDICVGGVMVAVINGSTPALADRLLAFGGLGVRDAVDMSKREGLVRLRALLSPDEWDLTRRVASTLRPSFEVATDEMRIFVRQLIRAAPFVSTVKALAEELRVRDTSLVSRFYRARLPSPKQYLAATRLLYAAGVIENQGMTVAQTARRLRYSSPQGFGRQVQEQLGVPASQFREQFPFDVMANRFADRLVVHYRHTLRWFEPLGRKVPQDQDSALDSE